MANFPTSLDSLVNPSAADYQDSVDHASQHTLANDAIEALEAKLGIGASVAASGKLLRGTGAGASAWDKDAPTGTIVGTTDTQTLTNKTLTSPTINTAIISNPTLTVDTISEHTGAAGVTIDGLLVKDSKLATNNSVVTANITDDAVTAAKIDWASTGANGGIWWEEIARTTLSVAGDTITVSSIPARRYTRILFYALATGGVLDLSMKFNNDSGANYSRRFSDNQGASSTGVSLTSIPLEPGSVPSGQYEFGQLDLVNVETSEKMCYAQTYHSGTAGAGTAPNIAEMIVKYVSASAISRFDLTNGGAGDMAAGSEVVVLGHN